MFTHSFQSTLPEVAALKPYTVGLDLLHEPSHLVWRYLKVSWCNTCSHLPFSPGWLGMAQLKWKCEWQGPELNQAKLSPADLPSQLGSARNVNACRASKEATHAQMCEYVLYSTCMLLITV